MLKLAVDTGYIHLQLTRHGLDWARERETFLDIYLGEGMHSVLQDRSEIVVDGDQRSIESFVQRRRSSSNRLMYIPAQREFVPLLLGLYWLLPASRVSRRKNIEWAVIEELEAGLHPAAISAVLRHAESRRNYHYKVYSCVLL